MTKVPPHLGLIIEKGGRLKPDSNPLTWIKHFAAALKFKLNLQPGQRGTGSTIEIAELMELLERVIEKSNNTRTIDTAKQYRYRVSYFEEHGVFPSTEVRVQKADVKFQTISSDGKIYVGLAAAGPNAASIARRWSLIRGIEVLKMTSQTSKNKINVVSEDHLRSNADVPGFGKLIALLDKHRASIL